MGEPRHLWLPAPLWWLPQHKEGSFAGVPASSRAEARLLQSCGTAGRFSAPKRSPSFERQRVKSLSDGERGEAGPQAWAGKRWLTEGPGEGTETPG